MINSIEFYCGMSREMKALKCSEMCVKTDDMIELVTRIRQAEKDAARYRWALDNCLLGIGRNGATWDLQFEGPAPGHIGQVSDAIDEAMQCK